MVSFCIAWTSLVLYCVPLYCMGLYRISWYCTYGIVLYCIRWCFKVMCGIARYCMVFGGISLCHCVAYYISKYNYGIIQYCKLLHGIIYWIVIYEFDLNCMILYCVAWYYMWLCTISLHCSALWQWAERFMNTIYNTM